MREEIKKVAVRATAMGFYGGIRRRKGAVFFVPEGTVGKWFEPTDPTAAALNNAALEDAALAKKAAEDRVRDAKIAADQEAADKKTQADADLKDEKKVIDAEVKKKLFGGLLGNRETPAEGSDLV